MSRIYYRNAKAAIVCYDVTTKATWERVEYWVKELHEVEPVGGYSARCILDSLLFGDKVIVLKTLIYSCVCDPLNIIVGNWHCQSQ